MSVREVAFGSQSIERFAAVADEAQMQSVRSWQARIRDHMRGRTVWNVNSTDVGGGVAEVIGKKLRWLGESRQVFCVTHLPQVASQAHHHFRVVKTSRADDTTTDVIALSKQERLEEIARMLGGRTITEQARAHADEMIAGQH